MAVLEELAFGFGGIALASFAYWHLGIWFIKRQQRNRPMGRFMEATRAKRQLTWGRK